MNHEIDISYGLEIDQPTAHQLTDWVTAALQEHPSAVSVAVRLVDNAESQTLNRDYRGKDYPTNVLSFPAELHPDVELNHIGDIVICVPVVETEAVQQKKAPTNHWAHMVTHGVLHLLGYDHIEGPDAERMEALERRILAQQGIADPY